MIRCGFLGIFLGYFATLVVNRFTEEKVLIVVV